MHPLRDWRARHGISRRGLYLAIRELTGARTVTDTGIFRWEELDAVPSLWAMVALHTVTDGEIGPHTWGARDVHVDRMGTRPPGYWPEFARVHSPRGYGRKVA